MKSKRTTTHFMGLVVERVSLTPQVKARTLEIVQRQLGMVRARDFTSLVADALHEAISELRQYPAADSVETTPAGKAWARKMQRALDPIILANAKRAIKKLKAIQ